MLTITSWNIQNGLGIDGQVSLKRITETIKENKPDIICLQEVSRFMPLPDGSNADQFQQLKALFPSYEAVFGAAIDTEIADQEERGQFGNMILSTLPIRSVFNHPLPQPADLHAKKHMARQCIEVTIEVGSKAFRIITTHLEFHSFIQRSAQSEHILFLQKQVAHLQSFAHPTDKKGPYKPLKRPNECIVCGDFNFAVNSPEYQTMTNPTLLDDKFNDAWVIANPNTEHAPTCGIFDHVQWPEKSHCRDFFFITDSLKNSLQEISVNQTSQASDHQPVTIQLDL